MGGGILIINFLLIGKWTWFQIDNKFEQFDIIENEDSIKADIDKVYEQYEEYTPYYFMDVCLKNFDMTPIYNFEASDKQFIVISDRARCNDEIEQLYEYAVYGRNGYELIKSKNHINILIYEE